MREFAQLLRQLAVQLELDAVGGFEPLGQLELVAVGLLGNAAELDRLLGVERLERLEMLLEILALEAFLRIPELLRYIGRTVPGPGGR
jgi:hypothetical protein